MKLFVKVFAVLILLGSLFFLVRNYLQNNKRTIDKTAVNFSPSKKNIEVILTGDIMLGRTVMTTSLGTGDPRYPFKKVADELQKADIVFSNLENPVVANCPKKTDGLIFCADPKMIEGLGYAGVDVVTLANNHSGNYGAEGLAETKKYLRESGIEYTHESLAVIERGITFGFLGFEFIDKNITDDQIELVRAVDGQVDVLIIGVHWGAEYQAEAGTRQREIAKKLVGGGADVIAGHHPHWVQNIDYCDKNGRCEPNQPSRWTGFAPVYYSLGNFVFDQMWSEETRKGLAVKLTFDNDGKIVNEERLPIYMKDYAQPEFTGN